MSAITIRIPDSLHKKIREIAKRDNMSINQFISSAAGEKLAAILTLDYLRERAKEGSQEEFDRILKKVPQRDPLEWDQLE